MLRNATQSSGARLIVSDRLLVITETPNSAKCSRKHASNLMYTQDAQALAWSSLTDWLVNTGACPCDDCARVLQCFSTGPGGVQDLWDRIDLRNSKNKEKQASKKRSAPGPSSEDPNPEREIRSLVGVDPVVPLPDTQPPPEAAAVAALPSALPAASVWTGANAIAAPWQPRPGEDLSDAADSLRFEAPASSSAKLRKLGQEQEQPLLDGGAEFQLNFAGKRACHGKNSPGAVVASLALLSVSPLRHPSRINQAPPS